MTPEENETIKKRAGKEKLWQWGDEIEVSKKEPEKKPELEGDSRTFTSASKLLDAERNFELKKAGERIKKVSSIKKPK